MQGKREVLMEQQKLLREYLKTKQILTDGAFGTYYAQLTGGQETASEKANLENPSLVKQIHKEYIRAGAKLIRTNTFGGNRFFLKTDIQTQKQILKKGYEIAAEVKAETEEQIFIAADIGPIPDGIEADSKLILEEYKRMCDAFLECGADIFVFETFSDTDILCEVSEYLKSKEDCFVISQFCLDQYGYTRSGNSAKRILENLKNQEIIDAIGFNCGIGAGHMRKLLEGLEFPSEKYITAMPNSGYPERIQNREIYLDNSRYFSNCMREIADLGVNILGGCCGTNPDYIQRIHAILKDTKKEEKLVRIQERKITNIQKNRIQNPFMEKLNRKERIIAVELDPPYDAKFDPILECAHKLKGMGVDILTFADSPMAKARVDSILTGVRIQSEVKLPVMPHISCRDRNQLAIRAQLLGSYMNGIRNLLLVTGDPIPSSDRGSITSVFDFHSIRLMEYVKTLNEEHLSEEPFVYGGAINFNRTNLEAEIQRVVQKMQAGASYFLTQPVYSSRDIERIRLIKKQTGAKIFYGIMPLISYRNAYFIQNEITGICVPDEVVQAFTPEMSREEGEQVGIQIAAGLMRKIGEEADGIYFMLPFNRVHLVQSCLDAEKGC